MTKPIGYTRRQFLGGSLAVISASAFLPMFIENSVLAAEQAAGSQPVGARPGVPEDRILVIVQLTGGNDGLNTVVPYGMDDYYRARPDIGLKASDYLKIAGSNAIGLNGTMIPFKEMMDAGLANIIMGVGYPNPNRSHFASMDIWHTADLRGGRGLGWIGRALDEDVTKRKVVNYSTDCISIGRVAPLATEGKLVKPIAFENPKLFRWTVSDLNPALKNQYDQMNRAGVIPHPSAVSSDASQADFVMRTALDAQLASDKVIAAIQQPSLSEFPKTGLAGSLKQVSAMIKAGLSTRVYYVSLPGFDSHANQLQSQNRLLGEFAGAIKAFYEELKATGHQDRVLTLAFSEFGRRVEQNASRGTDHGTAGPVFLFGPMIKPGLLGEHPSLAKENLDAGDLKFNADFRSVYATVLDKWMKIDSAKVLGDAFPTANVLNPALVG